MIKANINVFAYLTEAILNYHTNNIMIVLQVILSAPCTHALNPIEHSLVCYCNMHTYIVLTGLYSIVLKTSPCANAISWSLPPLICSYFVMCVNK